MGARADRRQHLLRFGRGEHEDQVLRWLLDDLEQGVEALRGDHVGLVDDEDAVPRLGRRVEGAVAQFAGVVDAAVARGVEFDDIEVAATAGTERHAGPARPARRRRRTLRAVQRARQDPGRGGLAAAAGAREQIRVIDATGVEGDAQGLGDVLLTHHLGKGRRSVLTVEGHAPRLPAPTDRPAAWLRRSDAGIRRP